MAAKLKFKLPYPYNPINTQIYVESCQTDIIGNSVMIASLNPDEGATGLGIGLSQLDADEAETQAEQTFACTINQNDAITFSILYIRYVFILNETQPYGKAL